MMYTGTEVWSLEARSPSLSDALGLGWHLLGAYSSFERAKLVAVSMANEALTWSADEAQPVYLTVAEVRQMDGGLKTYRILRVEVDQQVTESRRAIVAGIQPDVAAAELAR